MKPKFNRIVIAGAGGVGYWLTMALCRSLGGRVPITVYDPDTFEGGNGSLRLPKVMDPATHKVKLLRAQVNFFMGDAPPIVYPRRLEPAEFLIGDWSSTLVVDCTDMNQVPREELWNAFEAVGAKGLRVSYDGLGIATISPGPPLETGSNGEGNYAVMPNLAQSFAAAGLGAQAVIYMLYVGEPLDFQVHVPTPSTRSITIERRSDSNGDSNSPSLPDSEVDSGTDRDRAVDHNEVSGSGVGAERMADHTAGD